MTERAATMPVTHPAVKPDLERCRIGDLTVVTVGGRLHLGLDPQDAALLPHLDGACALPELVIDHGPRAADLAAELNQAGFLIGSEAPREPRVVLSRVGLEFDGFDRLVARVDAAFGSFLGRKLILWAGLAVAIAGLTVVVGRAPTAGASSATATLAVLVVWTLVSGLPHELAHALVVHRGGRRVGRAGFGMHWGAVSLFVDATDALFLPRRTRLAQTLAGPFSDAVIAGALGLVAVNVANGATAEVLLHLAVFSWLSVVINLSPLLELDGQHAIEDLLDEPDLHRESVAAFRRIRHDRSNRTQLLAAYAAAATAVGLAALALSVLAWSSYYAPLVVDGWSEGLVGKLMVILFAGPTLIAAAAWLLDRVIRVVASQREEVRS